MRAYGGGGAMGPAIALVLGLLAQAAPAGDAAPSDDELRNSPGWLATPSQDDLQAVYPETARHQKVRGEAVIDCTLDSNGRLTACRAVEETPPGYGFGAAAVRLAGKFHMTPLYPDGQSVAGGHVKIPVHFGPQHRGSS
ncbi:MAG: energy transducer TonB [Phenylobacterium sp.]|nr:MAG: energy transducer TonB [Phenylobacterium sp.]